MAVVSLIRSNPSPKVKEPTPWLDEKAIARLRIDPREECRIPDGDKAAEGFGVRKRGASLFFNFVARLKNGKTANVALGTVGVESIEEAREKARKLRKWVDRGFDPRLKLEEEQAAARVTEEAASEAEAMTLAQAISLKVASPSLREGTKKQYNALISEDSELSLYKLKDRRLDSITRKEWREILRKARTVYGPTSPQPAVIRRAIGALYRNAIAESDVLKLENPMADLKGEEFADPKNRRTDRIEAGQLSGWFRQLNHCNPTVANLAKWYLLTGMRDREARDLTWDEVKSGEVKISAARIKTHRDLLLPITPAMGAILEAQGRYKANSPYVFPAVLSRDGDPAGRFKRPVSSILPVLKKLGCSVHGMRRTAATFMDQLGVPENVRRHILNHSPDVSRGYVQRDVIQMATWLRRYHSWIVEQVSVPDFPPPSEAQLRTLWDEGKEDEARSAAEWASQLGIKQTGTD